MSFQTFQLPYRNTHSFSPLVYAYLDHAKELTPYISFPATGQAVGEAIKKRSFPPAIRSALVQILNRQYQQVTQHPLVKKNLELLAGHDCFTVCTAHQPNIFTGHLYFVYKILHAIKLAETLKNENPEKNFVPVYFMGSEDADLDELGEIFLSGDKLKWQTKQQGAVGRMKVDKEFLKMRDTLSGQIDVLPYGREVSAMLRENYVLGETIEKATFTLVNALFGKYGLIVFLPDSADVKRLFLPVMEKELREHFSATAVEETLTSYPEAFKIDAFGRAINLFYLDENGRNRIEKQGDCFLVLNTEKRFSFDEIIKDLHTHPERFSPNVILRPVLQETVLPNVAFIGGGGELAYWLRLKSVFEKAGVDFPVLFLRNSFLLINKKFAGICQKLKLDIPQLFLDEQTIANNWVKKHASMPLTLEKEKIALNQYYSEIQQAADLVDVTLARHTEALKLQALKKIDDLEKKILRAEKRKHEDSLRQVHKLKTGLFPGGLQERVENIMPWLAMYGFEFMDTLLTANCTFDPSFTVLTEE